MKMQSLTKQVSKSSPIQLKDNNKPQAQAYNKKKPRNVRQL